MGSVRLAIHVGRYADVNRAVGGDTLGAEVERNTPKQQYGDASGAHV
jgi:hypothetical protein